MTTADIFLFCLAVALGSYLQVVSGFALALIILGLTSVFGVGSITSTAIVVGVLGFTNSSLSLMGNTRDIRWDWLRPYFIAIAPTLIAGFYIVEHLSASSDQVLKWLLGAFLIVAAVFHMFKPSARDTFSGLGSRLGVGVLAGLFHGLFATAGPPVVYHLYRQPLSINQIRATLLTVFVFATTLRTTVAAVNGSITRQELILMGFGLPVVVVFTAIGRRWRPPLSDTAMRRLAFSLLALSGVSLFVR